MASGSKPNSKRTKKPADVNGDVPNAPAKTVVALAFLLFDASINRSAVEQVRGALKHLDPADRENTILDVWLYSSGGDAHSAYKIGLIFRSVASFIRVIVPDYAKSAATLLSLVADEVYMAPSAELGPLDAQVTYEQEGITVSALDRARSLDDLTETAMDIAIRGGGMVLQYTGLSRSEALSAMLDFSAKFLEPVVAKIDPTMLHWSNSLLRVAKEYGTRLMATRADCPTTQAASIPAQLLEAYPTHGFVVSCAEAQELGLPVKPMHQYPHLNSMQSIYEHADDRQVNYIGVVPLVEDTIESDDQGDEQDAEPAEAKGAAVDDATGGKQQLLARKV